ncbi:ABC transporter ATP-binding protein [Metamycoplasma neophronis]|uniref:ABC transporter ATP-binding protein n=1 Tax=Metamycoplasma neophronis TaxID=872983 RepID=A0ABY2Z498_9BACT|nr:ABC transporter ATP-binding protein [Metamycoplasma neophronis]TPR54100.1 ABC transporter ATP-binding protein [Metamycoplasma neophronis]
MENEYIVEVNHLTKTFKRKKALNDLSFKVKKGELYGFLGLNGAGKTTTLNIILGLLTKDSGTVIIDGLSDDKNSQNIRNKIGIVFQQSILDDLLSVKENLMSRAAMYHHYIKDKTTKQLVDDVVREFKLEEIVNQSYGSLSGGQRRRVDIARALVHRPEILFLDEPTTGLDPQSRKLVWDTLDKIQKDHKLTIVLTTHYMEEANNCNYAIILNKGQKIAEGTPAELKNKFASARVNINSAKDAKFSQWLSDKQLNFVYDVNKYIVKFYTYEDAKKFVFENEEILKDFELIKGTMDEVFLNVTEDIKEAQK